MLLLASGAAAADGRDGAATLEEAAARLEVGETVVVTRGSGEVVRGRLDSTAPLRLAGPEQIIAAGGRRPLAEAHLDLTDADVERLVVRRSDPLWNGALTGFGVGAALVLAADCNSPGCDEIQPLLVGGTLALATGAGALVDALTKKDVVVYEARRPRLSLAPLVDHDRRGLVVTLHWGR